MGDLDLGSAPTEPSGGDGETPSLVRELARTAEPFAGRLVPGARLGGRYTIERLAGQGGMGRVYLAADDALGKRVALKLVDERLSDHLARLRDEVKLAQEVTHPGVCRTHDLEEIEGRWLIKMEYIDGETLAERLAAGPLPLAAAVEVATRICAALAAAHRQGVVHRDLKPHNVMLERGSGRVVLMDFGIARDAPRAGAAEGVSGTPDYMAPEQVRGREVDARTDLYALGCVLYEMVAGERPFPRANAMAAALAHVNDPPPPLPAPAPERLRKLVARLLEKDPARRPASAEEVAAALAGPRRGRRVGIAAAAGVALLAAALVATRPGRAWQPEIRELPVSDENAYAPTFSPDGKSIAYVSNRDGAYRAYVEPLDGGPARAVTPRAMFVWAARWARDGGSLLVSAEGRIYRVPLAGGAPAVVAEEALAGEDCAGRLLLLLRGAGDCAACKRLVLRDGGGERELRRFGADETVVAPRCDRAGRRLLYARSDLPRLVPDARAELWTMSLDGGAPRPLTDGHPGSSGAFTPDGSSLVYSDGERLLEVPVDGSSRPRVLATRPRWLEMPDIAPDGTRAIYDIDVTSVQIYAQPLGGGRPQRLTSAWQQLAQPQVAPDGAAVIAVAIGSPDAEVVTIPVDSGAPVTLVKGESPALSPDGREVLYSVTGTGRVLAMPRAGGPPRPVTEVPGKVLRIAAGDDGTVHMLVVRPTGEEAWSAPLAGGDAGRELPPGWAMRVPAPRTGWSVALRRSGFGLPGTARFVPPGADLNDPSAREIATRTFQGAWAPDGRSWIYPAADSLARFDVETGEPVPLAEVDSTFGHAVSPDGRTLYTTVVEGRVRREMIVNLADRPRP
jgi:hypothetical protein